MSEKNNTSLTFGGAGAAPSAIKFVLLVAQQFNDFCDGDHWDGWQEAAEKFGIIECIEFDPDTHDDPNGYGLERGDPFYVLAADAKAVIAEARKAERSSPADGAPPIPSKGKDTP